VYEVVKEDKYMPLVLIVSTPKTSNALKKSIEQMHHVRTWVFSKSAVSFSLHYDMKKLMQNDLRCTIMSNIYATKKLTLSAFRRIHLDAADTVADFPL